MSSPDDFDDEHIRDEWAAQERAVREERQRADISNDNARVAQYRFIARTLRDPPLDPLPDDFSRLTAARIELLVEAADERFELWLQRGLIAVLAIAGIATTLYLGADWLRLFTIPAQQSAAFGLEKIGGWSLVVAGSLALSSAVEYWRRKIQSG